MNKKLSGIFTVGFLLASLVGLIAVTDNPLKALTFNSYARYSADAKIHQRERQGGCSGAGCLAPEIIANKDNPNNQTGVAADIINTYNSAVQGNTSAIDKLKDYNQAVGDKVQQAVQTQQAAQQAAQKSAIAAAQPVARTNASCGVGFIAEDTVCRNPQTGKIIPYADIVYYNVAIGNIADRVKTYDDPNLKISSLQLEPTSAFRQAISLCQAYGAICTTVQDIINFSKNQLLKEAVNYSSSSNIDPRIKDLSGEAANVVQAKINTFNAQQAAIAKAQAEAAAAKEAANQAALEQARAARANAQALALLKPTGDICVNNSECQTGFCGTSVGRVSRSVCADNPGVAATTHGQNIPDYAACQGATGVNAGAVIAACNYKTYQNQTALNAVTFNYVNAFAPQNIHYNWQQLGYSSKEACNQAGASGVHSRAGFISTCGEIAYTPEQAASSTKLGATIATVIVGGYAAAAAVISAASAGVPLTAYLGAQATATITTTAASAPEWIAPVGALAAKLVPAATAGYLLYGASQGPNSQAYQNAQELLLQGYAMDPIGFSQMVNEGVQSLSDTVNVAAGKALPKSINVLVVEGQVVDEGIITNPGQLLGSGLPNQRFNASQQLLTTADDYIDVVPDSKGVWSVPSGLAEPAPPLSTGLTRVSKANTLTAISEPAEIAADLPIPVPPGTIFNPGKVAEEALVPIAPVFEPPSAITPVLGPSLAPDTNALTEILPKASDPVFTAATQITAPSTALSDLSTANQQFAQELSESAPIQIVLAGAPPKQPSVLQRAGNWINDNILHPPVGIIQNDLTKLVNVGKPPEAPVIPSSEFNVEKVTVDINGDPFIPLGNVSNTEAQSLKRVTDTVESQVKTLTPEDVSKIIFDANYKDGLTGLYNKTAFSEGLELEVHGAAETGTDVTVLVVKAKNFKVVNDTLGHSTGDDVLTSFAKFMTDNTRNTDLASRIGGNEFALILPNTSEKDAETVAQRILTDFANFQAANPENKAFQIVDIDYAIKGYSRSSDTVPGFLKSLDQISYTGQRATVVPADLTHVTLAPDGDPFISIEGSYQADAPALARRASDLEKQIPNLTPEELKKQIVQAKYIDPLTGLFNRSGFNEMLQPEIDLGVKNGTETTVAMIDLKNFRGLNTAFGREGGDQALTEVGNQLLKGVRITDIPSRYGGDEFVIIFPNTTEEQAKVVMQRIEQNLAALKATAPGDSVLQSINIDYGLRQWNPKTDSIETFLKGADQQMYAMKGINKATTAPITPALPTPQPAIQQNFFQNVQKFFRSERGGVNIGAIGDEIGSRFSELKIRSPFGPSGFQSPLYRVQISSVPTSQPLVTEVLATPEVPATLEIVNNVPPATLAPSQKTWIDNLPIPRLTGGSFADIPDMGQYLTRYASHWNGVWDNSTKILTLNPEVNSNILKEGDWFTDISIATKVNGQTELLPSSGYKALTNDAFGHVQAGESEFPSTFEGSKLIFRGMNYEGMQSALQKGVLESGPTMQSRGLGNSIFFGTSGGRSISYAAEGEGYFAMSTFERPSFMIAIQEPSNPEVDFLGDVVIHKPITVDQIIKVYEVKPYTMTGIKTPLLAQHTDFNGNPLPNPSMRVPGLESFPLHGVPKAQFAYRELSLNEVENAFGITPPPSAEIISAQRTTIITKTSEEIFLDTTDDGIIYLLTKNGYDPTLINSSVIQQVRDAVQPGTGRQFAVPEPIVPPAPQPAIQQNFFQRTINGIKKFFSSEQGGINIGAIADEIRVRISPPPPVQTISPESAIQAMIEKDPLGFGQISIKSYLTSANSNDGLLADQILGRFEPIMKSEVLASEEYKVLSSAEKIAFIRNKIGIFGDNVTEIFPQNAVEQFGRDTLLVDKPVTRQFTRDEFLGLKLQDTTNIQKAVSAVPEITTVRLSVQGDGYFLWTADYQGSENVIRLANTPFSINEVEQRLSALSKAVPKTTMVDAGNSKIIILTQKIEGTFPDRVANEAQIISTVRKLSAQGFEPDFFPGGSPNMTNFILTKDGQMYYVDGDVFESILENPTFAPSQTTTDLVESEINAFKAYNRQYPTTKSPIQPEQNILQKTINGVQKLFGNISERGGLNIGAGADELANALHLPEPFPAPVTKEIVPSTKMVITKDAMVSILTDPGYSLSATSPVITVQQTAPDVAVPLPLSDFFDPSVNPKIAGWEGETDQALQRTIASKGFIQQTKGIPPTQLPDQLSTFAAPSAGRSDFILLDQPIQDKAGNLFPVLQRKGVGTVRQVLADQDALKLFGAPAYMDPEAYPQIGGTFLYGYKIDVDATTVWRNNGMIVRTPYRAFKLNTVFNGAQAVDISSDSVPQIISIFATRDPMTLQDVDAIFTSNSGSTSQLQQSVKSMLKSESYFLQYQMDDKAALALSKSLAADPEAHTGEWLDWMAGKYGDQAGIKISKGLLSGEMHKQNLSTAVQFNDLGDNPNFPTLFAFKTSPVPFSKITDPAYKKALIDETGYILGGVLDTNAIINAARGVDQTNNVTNILYKFFEKFAVDDPQTREAVLLDLAYNPSKLRAGGLYGLSFDEATRNAIFSNEVFDHQVSLTLDTLYRMDKLPIPKAWHRGLFDFFVGLDLKNPGFVSSAEITISDKQAYKSFTDIADKIISAEGGKEKLTSKILASVKTNNKLEPTFTGYHSFISFKNPANDYLYGLWDKHPELAALGSKLPQGFNETSEIDYYLALVLSEKLDINTLLVKNAKFLLGE